MIKLCVIGDSHVGAFKGGLNRLRQAQRLPVRPFWFIAHASRWTGLTIDGATIRVGDAEMAKHLAKWSGGEAAIDTARYDGFVIVGMTFSIDRLLSTALSYRTPQLQPIQAPKYLASEACLVAAHIGQLAETPAMALATIIRQLCDKPVIIVPKPLPSEDLVGEITSGGHGAFAATLGNNDQAALAALYREVCSGIETTARLSVVPQPSETIRHDIFTAARYARLTAEDGELDDAAKLGRLVHMNHDFGEIEAKAVLGATELLPRRVAMELGIGPAGNA